ncbi:hypothetical protein [Clostridium sp. UBA4548]|uniref:hypothetical protein n=1 Tax=Clostridium sp. UBA4548 TaxID=1946361 RepID=UPI0025BE08D9|nr:hypothetical protein [Clostridium sp. UBA4548]
MIIRGFNKRVIVELIGLSEEQVEKLIKERVSKYEHNLFANYIKESHVFDT